MAVSVGGLIEPNDYNSIRNTVNLVLGTGDGDQYGYGQPLSSVAVASNETVTADQMIDLYNDLFAARVHQTGNPPTWNLAADGLAPPAAGDLIGAEQTYIIDPNDSDNIISDSDAEGVLDFNQASQDIVAGRFSVGAGQMTQTVKGTSTRTSAWNNTITHSFTITFSQYDVTEGDGSTTSYSASDAARFYFNSGGELRIDLNLTGGNSVAGDQTATPPYQKDEIWQTMMNTMGTFKLARENSTSTGSGTGSSIGYYDLTTANQLVFEKDGSGVYAENRIKIYAKKNTDGSVLTFQVDLEDNDLGDDTTPSDPYPVAIDENVGGTTTSTVSTWRATGLVEVADPTYNATSNF